MAAFQRFGNPPLYVDDFAEIFLSMKEKLGVGKHFHPPLQEMKALTVGFQ
jgi:hypothetical protein